MITHKRLIAGAVMSGVLLLLSAGSFGSNANQQKSEGSEDRWEYLIVAGGRTLLTAGSGSPGERKQKAFAAEAAVERSLDQLGADGWELVAVSGTPNEPSFFLKRPAKHRQ